MTQYATSRGLSFRLAARLCDYTTFRLGGPCPLLIDCAAPADLQAVATELNRRRQEFVLIGGGSNLLIADAGLDAVVLRYASDAPAIEQQGQRLQVAGSTSLDALALTAARLGLGGLVECSGIPGTVGGAIVGNAGAFGWQVGDAIESVHLLSRDGAARVASAAELDFSYRDSALKRTGDIVLAATFVLPAADPTEQLARRQEILELRAGKHPDIRTHACAGSFFRNIEPSSKADRRQAAGRLLEEAGAKEMRVGGASVFPKHANIIINSGPDGTAQDVADLSATMAAAVRDKFGIDLVREVRFLGGIGEPDTTRQRQ